MGDGIDHEFFVWLTVKWIFPLFWFYLWLLLPISWSFPLPIILRFPLENIWTSMTTFRPVFWYNCLWSLKRTCWFVRLLLNISWLLETGIFDLIFMFDQIGIFISCFWLDLVMSFNGDRLIFIDDFSLWFILYFRGSNIVTFSFNICAFGRWEIMLVLRFFFIFLMFTWRNAVSRLWLLNLLLRFLYSIFLNPLLSLLLHLSDLLFP